MSVTNFFELPALLSSGSENITPPVSPLAGMDMFNDAQLEATLEAQYAALQPMLQKQMPTPAPPPVAVPSHSANTAKLLAPATTIPTPGAPSADAQVLQAALLQAALVQAMQAGLNQQAMQLLVSGGDSSALLLALLSAQALQQPAKPEKRASDRAQPLPRSKHSALVPVVPVTVPQPSSRPAPCSSDPHSDSECLLDAKEKNRLAQRRFRERQRNLITSLKEQADNAEAKYQQALSEISSLKDENKRLLQRLQQAQQHEQRHSTAACPLSSARLRAGSCAPTHLCKQEMQQQEMLQQVPLKPEPLCEGSCEEQEGLRRQQKRARLDLDGRQLQERWLKEDFGFQSSSRHSSPPCSSPGSPYSL